MRDEKAETFAVMPFWALFEWTEKFEKSLDTLLAHADPVVLHADYYFLRCCCKSYCDLSDHALGELDCVRDQVGNNLEQPLLVRHHEKRWRQKAQNLDILIVRLNLVHGHCSFDCLYQVQARVKSSEFAVTNLEEVQEVFDKAVQSRLNVVCVFEACLERFQCINQFLLVDPSKLRAKFLKARIYFFEFNGFNL